MLFSKPQVSFFLQILHHSSLLWKVTPLYVFSSNIIYFGQMAPIKMLIFETFECLGQNLSNFSCQFWNDKSIPFYIFHHSSLSWHIILYIYFLYFLSSCIFYFREKDPIKVPILRHSSGQVNICQIPYVIFQTTSRFFFKFAITFQCHER